MAAAAVAPPMGDDGLVAAQKDAYLRILRTTVEKCSPGEKKGTFNVVLSDTVLFPEGGGQPWDTGVLTSDVDGSKVTVSKVYKDNENTVLHVTNKPMTEGTIVTVDLDWDRRWDHMTHHCAQHLISAVAEDLYGWLTQAWALQSKDVAVELTEDLSKVTAEQLDAIERRVNEEIRLGRQVKIHVTDRENAFSGAFPGLRASAKSVPESVKTVRLVEIEGIDLNLCCGTHVNRLSEIQMVKFFTAESMRGGTRIYFRVADRILSGLASSITLNAQLTKALSCAPEMFPTRVEQMAKEVKATTKDLATVREELGVTIGASLAASVSGDGSNQIVTAHREEADVRFLYAIADTILKDKPKAAVLLTVGAPGKPGSFLLANNGEAWMKANGMPIAKALGGKGGGKGGKFQGKYTDLSGLPQAVAIAKGEPAAAE